MTIAYKMLLLVTVTLAVTCHKKCVTKNDAQNDRPLKDLPVNFQEEDDIGEEYGNERMDEFINMEGKEDEEEDVQDVFDSIFKDAVKPRKGLMARGFRWRQ